jgi:hypothetical protein
MFCQVFEILRGKDVLVSFKSKDVLAKHLYRMFSSKDYFIGQ